MITASCEDAIDYKETARVATEAFGSRDTAFYPEQFHWFYEGCFSRGTTVVALRDGNRKIGHCALVRQPVLINGVNEPAAQLVDLFILKEFRSKESLQRLYSEVERQCFAQKIRLVLGMPNARALPVNAHFFKMRPLLWLPIRTGVALPFRPTASIFSDAFEHMKTKDAMKLFACYRTPRDENGLQWDEEKLYRRLCGPRRSYGIHATEDLLLISSARSRRRVSYTLLCGFFVRTTAHVDSGDVRLLVRAACHFWKRPLFIHASLNNALPVNPGVLLPRWLRPSPMLLQLRDFQPERSEPRFDRYQLIDFDFA
jgi:hypothetical protein